MQGVLVRAEETAGFASSHHLLSLPVELLQHCILAFCCDDELDATLALRVVCRELRPLVEHQALLWMHRVLPTLLSDEYSARLPVAAADEEMEDDCSPSPPPASRPCPASYDVSDACWLSLEMRRWSVRDGRGGWVPLAVDEPQAVTLYGLSREELQQVESWRANRRYPGLYRHRMDVLHLTLEHWQHARLLRDWQLASPQAAQQLTADCARWQRLEKRRYELKLAMRSVGLQWQVAQWDRLAPYHYRHGRVRLCWAGTRWEAEVTAATEAKSDEATLHVLMLALGLCCAGRCGWGGCGLLSQMEH